MVLHEKQKYPGTHWNIFDLQFISITTTLIEIFVVPVAFVIKPFVFRHQWDKQLYIHLIRLHTSSPCCPVTMCALCKTILCLSAIKSCFTVTSAAPCTWAKEPISLVDQFLKWNVKPKKTSQRCKKTTIFTPGVLCIGVHTHIDTLCLVTSRAVQLIACSYHECHLIMNVILPSFSVNYSSVY